MVSRKRFGAGGSEVKLFPGCGVCSRTLVGGVVGAGGVPEKVLATRARAEKECVCVCERVGCVSADRERMCVCVFVSDRESRGNPAL